MTEILVEQGPETSKAKTEAVKSIISPRIKITSRIS
jgi:hypothetical protein